MGIEDNIRNSSNFIATKRSITIVLDSNVKQEPTKFDSGVDIVEETLVQLSDYVTNETQVAGNEFPIASTGGRKITVTTKTPSGNPASFSDAGENGQANYIDSVAPTAKTLFNQTSNSNLLGTDQEGPFVIKKGKQETDGPTGSELYRDINVNGSNSEISKRVKTVLLQNSKYNEDEKFIQNVGVATEDDLKLATVRYPTLGVFGPRKFPNSVDDIPKDNVVTLKEMKRLGVLTLLGGAGDIIPNLGESSIEESVFPLLTNLASTSPGIARLGSKVSVNRFESNNLLKTMKPGFNQATHTNFLDGKTNYSYGNVNTPFSPFSDANSIPSIATANVLVATVAGLVYSLSKLKFKNFEKNVSGPHSAVAKNAYMGSSTGTGNQESEKTIVEIPFIKNDFYVCLDEGLRVFFGFEFNVTPGNLANKTSKKISKIHGYYNTMMRQVLRGIEEISFDLGASFGLGQDSNFKGSVETIAGEVDPFVMNQKLNSLSIVKFIKILVVIGDKSLQSQALGGVENTESVSIYDIIDNELIREDENSIDPGILITKQNLVSKNNRSNLATSNKRSLLAMPIDFESARLSGDLTANPTRAAATLRTNNKVILEERISADEVRKFEDYLEKDYMPFYFQDLRTNEILSFHAFIDNINETITSDYVENEGFGRIGTVPIYKNTKRSISLSFSIVSTNSDDFDEMWFKLNKIATMLFPQWSEGRRINANGNTFIQPFSQVIAASPMIRFRVGDLHKSNYSKFSLAKLFGISSDRRQFNISNQPNTEETAASAQEKRNAVADRVREITQRRQDTSLTIANRFRVGEKITIDQASLHRNPGGSTGLWKVNDGNPSSALNSLNSRQNLQNSAPAGSNINRPATTIQHSTTEWLVPEEETVLTIERIVQNNLENFLICRVSGTGTTGARTRRVVGSGNRIRASLEPTNASELFIIPLNCIGTSPRVVYDQAISELYSESSTPSQTDIANQQQGADNTQQFFSTADGNTGTANPIMKAFKTTEGRGIAGFIKTMTPEFSDVVWETEKFGGRAPKFLKITLEIIPIFDLPPGLDHKGAMTAPIWNVGTTMNDLHGGRGLESASSTSFKNSKVKIPRY